MTATKCGSKREISVNQAKVNKTNKKAKNHMKEASPLRLKDKKNGITRKKMLDKSGVVRSTHANTATTKETLALANQMPKWQLYQSDDDMDDICQSNDEIFQSGLFDENDQIGPDQWSAVTSLTESIAKHTLSVEEQVMRYALYLLERCGMHVTRTCSFYSYSK
ncbi:hypothetical protein AeNC1_018599, partial [Aphanomyces euteiches]